MNATQSAPTTLFEKVWQHHLVAAPAYEPSILYIDLHLVHEVTSPQAFEGLRMAGRTLRRPDRTVATVDHNVPTTSVSDRLNIVDQIAARQVDALRKNCADFGVELYDVQAPEQGIVHIIGPELGLTKPGMTIVCGDSHTSTHGAFGALGVRHRDQRSRARHGHPNPPPGQTQNLPHHTSMAPSPTASPPRTSSSTSSGRSAPPAPPATSSSTPAPPSAPSPWKAA